MSYARLRNRERKSDSAYLYEATFSDVRIMNWAGPATVQKLKGQYVGFIHDRQGELNQQGAERLRQKYDIPETLDESTIRYAFDKVLKTCSNKDELNQGNIKKVSQGLMGVFFENFVQEKGCDGVITFEGGDDPELTSNGGLSVVIFNTKKITSHRAFEIT